MDPSIAVALLWLVFAGTHVGLATRPVRTRLLARLGEWGFVAAFSAVASIAFAVLVHAYATHRFEGPVGPAYGAHGPVRVVLESVVVVGLLLAGASFAGYPASAYALAGRQSFRPRGLERITRHPFFVGTGMAAVAHALLASRLVGSVFFGGLALLSFAGAWHQDRKLREQRGPAFASFLAATSVVPFAAVAAGRQDLALGDLPWRALAGSAAGVLVLARAHDVIFAAGGAWVIAVVVGGAWLQLVQTWRLERRRTRRTDQPSAPDSRSPAMRASS